MRLPRPDTGVPPSRRRGDEDVRRDRRLSLSAAALSSHLARLGVFAQDLLLALEACVGGASFGEGYFRVEIGLRLAFDEQGGRPPRTPDGRVLLCWAVEGDMRYFVTPDGEIWTQDGIADSAPHHRGDDPVTFAERFNWPVMADLTALARPLDAG